MNRRPFRSITVFKWIFFSLFSLVILILTLMITTIVAQTIFEKSVCFSFSQ